MSHVCHKQPPPEVLPRSALGKAVGYMNSHGKRLVRFVQDGRLAIDNNFVENAVRPVALLLQNWEPIQRENSDFPLNKKHQLSRGRCSEAYLETAGVVFQDEMVATALLDRLLHHAVIFKIQGKSYRMKDKMFEAIK